MKVSQLISIFEDIKRIHGDKHIWSIDDLGFPCPREINIELVDKLTKTKHGFSGGKADRTISLTIDVEYEDGVDVCGISFN